MEETYFLGANFVIALKVTGIMSNSELTRQKSNNITQIMFSFMPLPKLPIAMNRTKYAAPKSNRPAPIFVIDEISLSSFELNILI